jgi:hypothetical protein
LLVLFTQKRSRFNGCAVAAVPDSAGQALKLVRYRPVSRPVEN